MGRQDQSGPGRQDRSSGGSTGGSGGSGTGPGRTEGGGRAAGAAGAPAIWGSGPGRGVPWWRWHGNRVLTLRHVLGAEIPGLGVALGRPEPAGIKREGRTVARIRGTRQ
jgi:hypothetical protein